MKTKIEVLGDVLENKLDWREIHKEMTDLENAINALDFKLAKIQFSDQIGIKKHQAYMIRHEYVRDLTYHKCKIIDYIRSWNK